MKVYDGFGGEEIKNKYICKSEITRDALRKMNIPEFVTVQFAKEVFDSLKGINVFRGVYGNREKRHITKYVLKFELYRGVIKGVDR